MTDPVWKRKEREDARWLLQHDEPDPNLRGVYSSSGRVGHVTGLQRDQQSKHYIGESKRRELPKWLRTAIDQVRRLAKENGRHWVLFLHLKGQGEPVHIISREDHAELLEYRKRVLAAEEKVKELEEKLEEATLLGTDPEREALEAQLRTALREMEITKQHASRAIKALKEVR